MDGLQTRDSCRPHKRARRSFSNAVMDDYDVFLNHRGPDVKAGFIAHLHDALRSGGLNSFLDKSSLVKGGPASSSIDDALDMAKVHVAVVSSGYAESKHPLRELVAMIRSGKPVIPVFYDVEPADLRRVENGPFAAAFEKHKSRERVEQVEEWADALRELADITGFCFRLSDFKGDEAELKWEVVDAVMSLISTNEALQVEPHLVGLERHMNTCIHELEKMCDATCVLGLVGTGGIGKTSLAKEIYNHLVGHKKFSFMSFLEIGSTSPVSMEVGPSLLSRMQKQLLWDLLRVPYDTPRNYEYWFKKISSQGPVLIVLDDIHDKSQFDKLIFDPSLLPPGSCIIVTSRDRHLLKVVARRINFYLHEVTTLGDDDSQKLFNWHVFGDEEAPTNFKALAHDVSKACGGLPLALKVVGCSLCNMTSNENREHIWPEAIDALRDNPKVTSALKWSYNCLPQSEKLMFVDIATVFCGWEKQAALDIWKSCKMCPTCCGSKMPNFSLQHLIDKSLVMLEDSGRVLAMHSLLRDIGRNIGKIDGSHLWEVNTSKVVFNRNEQKNKVRAINLTSNGKYTLNAENFAKFPNLHFLILDGCHVSGDLINFSRELRCLQWKYMPLIHLPATLNLSKLISLDFSRSTKLANLWVESNTSLEGFPNLHRLCLRECTSITELPDFTSHLSQLQVLDLGECKNLHKLPSSIGQLTALKQLVLNGCERLEALPDTITALSGLKDLYMYRCSSISKLPTTVGLMTGLRVLGVDLATEWQVVGIGQINVLEVLVVTECIDEIITVVDSSGTLRNLNQLLGFYFWDCSSITKLPETIGLLRNLEVLYLRGCERLQELPNSIGQLKVLGKLQLIKCSSLKTLPDSVGELISLETLIIEECTSITRLPDTIWQLNALEFLMVSDCGSLESLGASRVLQDLRIWGCTSIRELPGSCLLVADINRQWVEEELQIKKGFRLLEATDCGSLSVLQDARSRSSRLIRTHELPCCKLTVENEEEF